MRVRAYGESFIEDGIPAAEMNDGWAVTFSKFQVGIEDVAVAGVSVPVPATVELTTASDGAGHLLGSASAPAGEHTGARFTLSRVELAGTATLGTQTKTFSWVFDRPTRYDACETTTNVPSAGEATFQITVHADHLFYDSMVAEQPQLRFQALADADADSDGTLTQPELAATDIGAYDPGSADGVDDLWSWLVAQTRTLGHVDGEGHCRAAAVD